MKLFASILLAALIAFAAPPATVYGTEVLNATSKALAPSPPPKVDEAVRPASPPEVLPLPKLKTDAQAECKANWTAKKYKAFDSVQNEIRKRYGDVRILRVALCGEGVTAYFQIIIMSGQGSVSRIKITAAN